MRAVREINRIIYHSKGLDESYPKMQILSNLSNFVKSYGHLSEILVWSHHVTPGANFENL